MPEGAEVRRVADALHDRISGKWIRDIKINEKSRYFKTGGIEGMYKLSFPLFISCINSKGKKIVFECLYYSESKKHKIFLISSLAMTGRWQYHEDKHSGIELILSSNPNIKKSCNSVVESSAFFDDQRHFGSLHICFSEAEVKEVLGAVGPDLLSEDISFDYYNTVISNKRLESKQICGFLLEQKYFSGVGNWVRAEVLYEACISPHRTLCSLTEDEKYLVYYYSIKILREAYEVRGLTISNYIDPEGELGTYEVKVYGQDKDPFGNTVVREVLNDKRTIHWVPQVQK
jgi:DNA-formamidopyrimidine glycosylase